MATLASSEHLSRSCKRLAETLTTVTSLLDPESGRDDGGMMPCCSSTGIESGKGETSARSDGDGSDSSRSDVSA